MLDPGPDDIDRTPDVLVVGGGVVGLATAVMCRRAGLGRVQVIERDTLAAGPSGSAAGGLSPGMHTLARPGDFARIAHESLALHSELDEEWDGALGLRTIDWLIVSPDRIAAGEIDVQGVRAIGAAEARAAEPRLHPEIAGAISVPRQSWVHPLRLAVELALRASAIATSVAMERFETRGDAW